MSFSTDIKQELLSITNQNVCCNVAQLYGMLEFGRSFSKRIVSLQTENRAVLEKYVSLISSVCGVTLPLPENTGMQTISSTGERIVSRFGHENEVTLRINRANFECDTCVSAYLRGAFLVCGAVTNPQVDYHLEFSVPYYTLCQDLMTLMGEVGLLPKSVKRKGNYIVYFKESEQIEDCLTFMGAMSASLELMNVKMIKDIRNNVNRVANCENANIEKVVAAATVQTQAVRRIESTVGIASLPQELRDLCRLRLENPDFSLRELGEALDPPLSRSGVNHRFERILEIADNL